MITFTHSSKNINGMIKEVGGAPLVTKLLSGTQGWGCGFGRNKKSGRKRYPGVYEAQY